MNSSGQRTLASGETLASGPNSLKASDKQMLFDWICNDGDKIAGDLGCASLPAAMRDLLRKAWADAQRRAAVAFVRPM